MKLRDINTRQLFLKLSSLIDLNPCHLINYLKPEENLAKIFKFLVRVEVPLYDEKNNGSLSEFLTLREST